MWNTLIESSQTAAIFLDRHLVVRRFTSRAAAIFDLHPGDSGRSLTDIARSLGDPDLRRDIRAVLEAGEPRECCLAIRTATEAAPVRYLVRLSPYRTVHGVDGVVASFTDVTRLVEAEERQRFRVAELNHRINNMLAVAIGLARQTLAYTSEPTAFAQAFQARLHALRRTTELLSREQYDEIDLRELLMRALQPYALVGDASRATTEGPPVTLRPKAALALGMVAHELATNAMKHGALSVLEGRVTVRWSLGGRAGERRLILSWEEHGGPSTADPATEGFGLKLIRRLLSDDLGGEAQIGYQQEGLWARLAIPANPMLIRIGDQARQC